MNKKILVPIDGSDDSMLALKCAAEQAIALGADLTVLHVMNVPVQRTLSGKMKAIYNRIKDDIKEEAQDILEKAKKEIASYNITYEEKMMWGEPAEEIVNEAKQGGYGMIVIGSRGLSEVKGWILGSVSQRVTRHASCPVLVVR